MNPADQRFEGRWLKRLAKLEKDLQDIKTAQRMGLDNFVYDISGVVSTSIFMASGEEHILRINYVTDDPKLYASELSFSFFINNDLDPDYHHPDGVALTDASNLRPLDFFAHYDLTESDELGAGRKTYYIRFTNYSIISKTVHLHAALVFPKGNVT